MLNATTACILAKSPDSNLPVVDIIMSVTCGIFMAAHVPKQGALFKLLHCFYVGATKQNDSSAVAASAPLAVPAGFTGPLTTMGQINGTFFCFHLGAPLLSSV